MIDLSKEELEELKQISATRPLSREEAWHILEQAALPHILKSQLDRKERHKTAYRNKVLRYREERNRYREALIRITEGDLRAVDIAKQALEEVHEDKT